jgi:hypothetical protein
MCRASPAPQPLRRLIKGFSIWRSQRGQHAHLGLSIAIKNSKHFQHVNVFCSRCDQKQPQQPHFGADARLGTRSPPEPEIMGEHGAGHHGGCRHSAGSCAGGFAGCVTGPGLRRSWARSTPYPRQEPETQLNGIEVTKDLVSASYGTGQPSGCQYSPDVRTDRGTTYATSTS